MILNVLHSIGYGIIAFCICGIAMMFLTVAFGFTPALRLHLEKKLSRKKFDYACRCYTIINWIAAGVGFTVVFLLTL